MKTVVFLFLSVFLIKCECSVFKLKYVQVFFRHGSRSPDLHELYPNDPYIEFLKNTGLGQLTEEGQHSSCKLGNVLRNRYKNFFNDVYNDDAISAQTTNSDRTNLTAKLVLNGLLNKPCNDNPNVNYNITSKKYELALVNNYCPAYIKELQRILNTTKTKNKLKNNEKCFQYLSIHTGQTYRSFREVLFLYETLAAEKALNLPLPLWADQIYEKIEAIAVMQLKYESFNRVLKRLNGGRMLRKVVDHIQKKIEDAPDYRDKKMYLYSGHDFTIANILNALNVFKPHFPNFNSAIALELYQHSRSNKYYIKIVYFKNINRKPQELKIPKCNLLCKFSRFKKIMFPYLPVNYTKECNSELTLE